MELINEYDQTKELLNIIREGNILRENETIDIDEDENLETQEDDSNKIEVNNEDLNSFQELFSPLHSIVKVKDLFIYKDVENVIGRGQMNGDGELTWVFDLNKGLTITTIDFRLDGGSTMSDINKLKGIYTNWQKEWGNKLQTEYLNQSDL
jgi:hypothetical protein